MKTRPGTRSRAILGALCVMAVIAAGCAPADQPGGTQPLGQTAGGATLSGNVTFANTPLPWARVQLRTADWRTNPDSVVAETVADDAGQFVFDQPPLGEYVITGEFPDGEQDEGGWPVVNVQPDQPVTLFVVPLERHLTLLEPADDAQVTGEPILTWESFPHAAEYRVWVIDAGTTKGLVDQMTPEPLLTLALVLTPGQTYRWVVNALSEDGCVLASGTREFTYSASDGS